MTTGTTSRRAAAVWHIVFWLCLSLWSVAGQAGEWSLQVLMARLAEVEQSRVRYEEVRQISLLGVPLRSSGELWFRAPDYLKKSVYEGGQGSYEIEGERLRIEERGAVREMAIDAHPVLQAFVASFRATLAGDLATLQRYYHLSLEGGPSAWTLKLLPRSAEMASVIREITIRGSGKQLQEVFTLEPGGDSSLMTIRGDSAP